MGSNFIIVVLEFDMIHTYILIYAVTIVCQMTFFTYQVLSRRLYKLKHSSDKKFKPELTNLLNVLQLLFSDANNWLSKQNSSGVYYFRNR